VDPLAGNSVFGALVTRSHLEKVRGYVDLGKKEGARMVHQTATDPPFPQGFYFGPTIFDDVRLDYRIAQEEIFGRFSL
jgi:acyl-CoA reductase-like NAD-dependent aldehyde dehydrogenase